MRLIDADKVLWKMVGQAIPQSAIYTKAYLIVKEELRNAETVEAIPVKWLEDYQIKEFIKANPDSVDFQRACGIGCAIAAWRKENGTTD